MGQNDLQHEQTVESQVAMLSARVQAIAGAGVNGAQVSQPITLGSLGAPPFAAPDGSYLTPISSVSNVTGNYPRSSISFNLTGPLLYAPPTGFGITHSSLPSPCSATSTTVICTSTPNRSLPIKWNITGKNAVNIYANFTSGQNLLLLNFSTNSSHIFVSGLSGMPTYVQVLGSNDTLSLTNNGGGNGIISVNITGSYDTIATNSFPGGSSTVVIHVVGDHNVLNGDAASSGGGNTFYISIIGTSNSLALTPAGGDTYYVYLTGFDSLHPTSASCPYGAVAHTNSITGYNNGIGQTQNAKLYESFNNSTAFPGGGTTHPGTQSSPYRFTITNSSVASVACPYTTLVTVPVTPSGVAGFVVHLQNTYAPPAEVAYDQGAVVYAQSGGLPIFIVPPPVTLVSGTLTVFLPWFANPVPGEAGLGSADVSLRVLSTLPLTFPVHRFSFTSGSSIVIKWTTPYAEAWYSYFHTSTTFTSYATCSGSNSVCSAFYNPAGHSLGTVTLTIPAAGLTLNVLGVVLAASVL